jgi:hypothetical protein
LPRLLLELRRMKVSNSTPVLTVVTETTSHVASRQEVVIAQRGAETNRSRVTVSAIDRG